MNVLDLFLVVAFLGVFAVGFMIGVARVIAALLSIFLGLIGAGLFYLEAGEWLQGVAPSFEPWVADLTAFFFLFLFFLGATYFFIGRSFAAMLAPARAGVFSLVLLGFLSIVLSSTMVTSVLQVTAATVDRMPVSNTVTGLSSQIEESAVSSAFLKGFGPYIYGLVAGWMPGDAVPILQPPSEKLNEQATGRSASGA